MKVKRITALLLGLALTFSLAACSSESPSSSSSQPEPSDASQEPSSSESSQSDSSAPESEPSDTSETGNTLVVYFSATGNTEQAANYIAEITGGDLFALEPADPYTSEDLNWTNEDSRVVYEHDNPDARAVELVADTVDNWEDYDTVFIGYPIWWGIAAWPVDTFVEANDFTGKTVIPFCTSSSSGIGDSGNLLEELAGTGNWLEGGRFSSGVTEETVQAWIDSLGL